jgi:hypothetical protein
MTYLKLSSQYMPLKAEEPHGKRQSQEPLTHPRIEHVPRIDVLLLNTDHCQGASWLQAADTPEGTGNAPCLQIISYLSTIVQLSHPTCM